MIVAIPQAQGLLCERFGQCETFLLFDVDPQAGQIRSSWHMVPPLHQERIYPPWLVHQGVDLVLAAGMGVQAMGRCAKSRLQVVVGAPCEPPERVVWEFLGGIDSWELNRCAEEMAG